MGPSTAAYDTGKAWFRKLSGGFSMRVKRRSDRQVAVNNERLFELTEGIRGATPVIWQLHTVPTWGNSCSSASLWKGMEIRVLDSSWFERSPASYAERCVHKLVAFLPEFDLTRYLVVPNEIVDFTAITHEALVTRTWRIRDSNVKAGTPYWEERQCLVLMESKGITHRELLPTNSVTAE